MSYIKQGSSKACIVCPYVRLLTTFLKISTLDFSKFFCMWLRIFNLEKLNAVHFKLCSKKTSFLRYDPKCFWPISLQDLQNLSISLWKSIDSLWFKNTLFELFNLQLCLFFLHEMMKFYESICSAWISCTFAELFFLTDWSRMRCKNTIEISLIKLNVLL